MSINKLNCIIIIILAIVGCNNYNGKLEQYPELKNKKIKLIDTLELINNYDLIGDLNSKNIKVINLNWAGCTSCILEMEDWAYLIKEEELLKDVTFIFFANGELTWNYNYHINNNYCFPFPIFHDPEQLFEKYNKLADLEYEHTAVLNEQNKIIYIGSPIKEPKLLKSFLKCIKRGLKQYN